MIHIESFDDLKKLPNGTKVDVYNLGRFNSIIVVGTIPNSTGLVVVYGDNYSKAEVLYKSYFDKKEFILSTSYNQKESGELMIKQIEEFSRKEINDIKEVYLK